MTTGKLIVLNGASSAGKTTLALSFQQYSEDVFLHCTVDMFWNMTPRKIPANSMNSPSLKPAMADCVLALIYGGHNVIVDIVMAGAPADEVFLEKLKSTAHTCVHVACDLNILETREKQRGDRKLGLARSQVEAVARQTNYDLVIDTTQLSPQACAAYLHDYVKG